MERLAAAAALIGTALSMPCPIGAELRPGAAQSPQCDRRCLARERDAVDRVQARFPGGRLGRQLLIVHSRRYETTDSAGRVSGLELARLVEDVRGRPGVALSVHTAMAVSRHVFIAWTHGEFAARTYPVGDGGRLCVVMTGSRVSDVASASTHMTGLPYRELPAWLAVDPGELFELLLVHEIGHCLGEAIQPVGQTPHATHVGECAADAFATLEHLQRGGDARAIQLLSLGRLMSMLSRGDVGHACTRVIDAALAGAENLRRAERLATYDTQALYALAVGMARAHVLSADEFTARVRRLHQAPAIRWLGQPPASAPSDRP